MSRLDIFTIIIVVICVAAILFLLYRTTDLFKGKAAKPEETPLVSEDSLYTDDSDTLGDYDTDYEYPDSLYSDVDTAVSAPVTTKPVPATKPAVTAEVEEEEPETKKVESLGGTGDYLVVVGSFKVKSNAENQAKKLRGMGYDESEVVLFDRGTYARVLVDRFDSQSDAQSLVSELKGKGIADAAVHKKRN